MAWAHGKKCVVSQNACSFIFECSDCSWESPKYSDPRLSVCVLLNVTDIGTGIAQLHSVLSRHLPSGAGADWRSRSTSSWSWSTSEKTTTSRHMASSEIIQSNSWKPRCDFIHTILTCLFNPFYHVYPCLSFLHQLFIHRSQNSFEHLPTIVPPLSHHCPTSLSDVYRNQLLNEVMKAGRRGHRGHRDHGGRGRGLPLTVWRPWRPWRPRCPPLSGSGFTMIHPQDPGYMIPISSIWRLYDAYMKAILDAYVPFGSNWIQWQCSGGTSPFRRTCASLLVGCGGADMKKCTNHLEPTESMRHLRLEHDLIHPPCAKWLALFQQKKMIVVAGLFSWDARMLLTWVLYSCWESEVFSGFHM